MVSELPQFNKSAGVCPGFWAKERTRLELRQTRDGRHGAVRSRETEAEAKEQWRVKAEEMYDELYEWRERHPEASFDEIASQVTVRRQELMGELMSHLALQHGSGEEVEGLVCEGCGQELRYKGKLRRGVGHLEGEADLKRAYYHCPECESGIFPPGPAVEVSETPLESSDDRASGGTGDTDSLV
jgi:hypothetical protein